MVNKVFCILACFILLISFCSCALTENGNSLYAFCERINALDSSYNLSPTGFIVSESDKSLTKFFRVYQKEIMLQLVYNEDNLLTTLHIVFDNSEKNNAEEEKFIKNSIYAFADNTTTIDSLLVKIDFDNAIQSVDMHTKKAKIDNIEMLIDVTDIGTVITVVKNIL